MLKRKNMSLIENSKAISKFSMLCQLNENKNRLCKCDKRCVLCKFMCASFFALSHSRFLFSAIQFCNEPPIPVTTSGYGKLSNEYAMIHTVSECSFTITLTIIVSIHASCILTILLRDQPLEDCHASITILIYHSRMNIKNFSQRMTVVRQRMTIVRFSRRQRRFRSA